MGTLPSELNQSHFLGLASDGVCRAFSVAGKAVSSYFAVSPLPVDGQAVSFLRHFPSGFPGRSLTVTLFPGSPDFPPSVEQLSDCLTF